MFGSKEQKLEKMIAKNNVSGIISLITSKDPALSLKAVEALGRVTGDDAYNTLITLLRSPRADVRAAAATSLANMGDAKAQAHISHMLPGEKDAVVIEAMKNALSKLHTKD